jgi:putative ABC transporter-associated repeat protein
MSMTRSTMTRWSAAVLAAATLTAATWTVTSATAVAVPNSAQRTVLNDVHTDSIDVQYADGRLALKTRVGNGSYQHHDPSEVIFQLRDNESARLAVPDAPEFAFLGPAGSPVWLAPQVQDPSLLFAGWDTESLAPGVFAGDAVDFHLRSVSGPGRVEIFQIDALGLPLRVFSSTDAARTTLRQGVAEHVHANWAFSALGRYKLTFEVTATTVGGAAVSSGLVDFTWYVGGINASDVIADNTTTTLTVAPGVTLTGVVTPAGAQGWIEFLDGTNPVGYSEVRNGTAVLTTKDLTKGVHTLSARFVPRYSNDYKASVSAPVTYEVTTGPTTSPTTSNPTTATTVPTSTSTTSATASSTTTKATTTTTQCVPTTARTGVVLNQGHVDYAARILGGRLVSQVKDGTSGTPRWRSPSEVVFHLKSEAATTVPSDAFAFLGPVSAKIWQIPQTQKPGVVWLGWNTEEISATQATGEVAWKLTAVSGPGSMAVYELDAFGKPVVIFNSKDGLPDNHNIRLGTHAHGNWAFTASGAYKLTFSHSVKLTSGATVTDTQTVTFAIGDIDPNGLLPTTTTGCGAGGTSGTATARLASTGVSLMPPLLTGAGLVLTGGVLLLFLRRRQVRR